MPTGVVYYDVTELVTRPQRTGIQRFVRELAAHWSGRRPLVPVRVGPDSECYELPAETFAVLGDYFAAGAAEGDPHRRRLVACGSAGGPRRQLGPDDALLNAEISFDPARLALYGRLREAGLGGQVFFVNYDFLPQFHPQFFQHGAVLQTMNYVRTLRQAANVAFISRATRDEYLRRVVRAERPVGPVLPLGGDGFGIERPAFRPGTRRFTVVGTVEPRKNPAVVLDAFEALWAAGHDAELVFAGRLNWLEPAALERMRGLARSEGRFRWREDPDDAQMRSLIRGSRATIYPSAGEGFGLPPLESLALGVPVIVTASLPSLGVVEPRGQVRLAAPTAEAVRRAVLRLLDDGEAARLTAELEGLRVPRWSEIGPRAAAWIDETLARRGMVKMTG
jgi:glycosyltransferase involved in cell wall biosynthesis